MWHTVCVIWCPMACFSSVPEAAHCRAPWRIHGESIFDKTSGRHDAQLLWCFQRAMATCGGLNKKAEHTPINKDVPKWNWGVKMQNVFQCKLTMKYSTLSYRIKSYRQLEFRLSMFHCSFSNRRLKMLGFPVVCKAALDYTSLSTACKIVEFLAQ